MVRYVKCPRCELNYIDEETQEYCDVCLAEMKGDRLQFADFDEDDIDDIDVELEQSDICPVCGINSIRFGEKMCESCKQNSEYDSEDEVDIDEDEEWKNYLDEDDGDLTVDDETLEEELEGELDDDDDDEEFINDDYPLGVDDDDDEFDDDFDDVDLDDDDDDDFDDDDDDF